MPQSDISKMNFKELRNEVETLRGELERFKRIFEDAFSNIDSSNFSKHLTMEQNDMKTKISITAEKIEATVKKSNELESKITQTAADISLGVYRKYNLDEAVEVETEEGMTDITKAYKLVKDGIATYYYYSSITNEWTEFGGDSIYSLFKQTADGFEFDGDVAFDGNGVVMKNLKLGGSITWDMTNSPVKARYSATGSQNAEWSDTFDPTEHKFMQMSFNGGNSWSNATKVVGDDGSNGSNGTNGKDATVNAENVFNALTQNGGQQGLFPFTSGTEADENGNLKTKLFINAEYIRSGTLSGLKFASADNGTFIKLGDANGNYGDFALYRHTANETDPYDTAIYKIEDGQSVITFKAMGDNIFMTTAGESTYPQGIWDFSKVKNIIFPSNSEIINAVAIFG